MWFHFNKIPSPLHCNSHVCLSNNPSHHQEITKKPPTLRYVIKQHQLTCIPSPRRHQRSQLPRGQACHTLSFLVDSVYLFYSYRKCFTWIVTSDVLGVDSWRFLQIRLCDRETCDCSSCKATSTCLTVVCVRRSDEQQQYNGGTEKHAIGWPFVGCQLPQE